MRVFKYRGGNKEILKRDLRSLAKSQIYMAPLQSLNDPFEAKIITDGKTFEVSKILNLVFSCNDEAKIKEAEKGFSEILKKFIETSLSFGIYSMSNSYNDELLWAYYADAHRGFCIEYDLEKLKEYKMETEPTITVEYNDKMPIITTLDLFNLEKNKQLIQTKLVGTKSKRWKHEQEIRIVTGQTGLYDYDYRALKSIYFGYRSEERFRKLTMRVLKGRGIKYYLMQPKNGSYEFEKIALDDPFINAPHYLFSIAPVEDGIPYFDTITKPYEDLILKAIEIVRREPYCDKVIDADLSSSKGTKENPVIFVTYMRSDGLPKNFFIAKNEILAWKEENKKISSS